MPYFYNKLNQKIAYKFFKGKSPGIIFIHGLNSNMQGTKALSIEKYAKKRGISFLKFDCRGHGKSQGNFNDFTISDWKNDLLNMIDITKGPQILIGSSMGGWLMFLVAKLRKPKICGLIGLAAAPDFTKPLFKELPIKNRNQIKQYGITQIKKGQYKYVFSKNFFIDGNKNAILKRKLNITIPIILIHGLKDKEVKPQLTNTIAKKISGKNIQIRFLKNSDHSLSKKNDLKIINNAISNILNLI
ncbi:MAG: hypothetical protein CFH19_00429 [Alphaproteobacteria bacterium MarineAlpha5_Bin9]|nr:MAG: hypothetical protein CFH19_00429 [Alphaproteobacteria bacterium MarineAlpha5_Bin9]|tara:strand:- start:529 stop:1260 length:732 start_codon:yes stop_codon:yes gene_type:complete